MKLHFLINSLGSGGAEKVITRLSYGLKPHKIFLLEREVLYNPYGKVEFLSSFSSKTSPLLKTLYIPVYVQKLKQRLQKGDIIISFLDRANFVNILLGKEYKRIISVRTFIESRNKIHPYRLLMRKLYLKADIIVVPNQFLRFFLKKWLSLNEDTIRTIYNPIDPDKIKNLALESLKEYEILMKNPYIITVGRLTKAKGHWYLLRIFKQIKIRYKDLKLIILGNGELKNYLVELSENLGLKTYVWDRDKLNETYDVYFLGFQKNPYKFIRYAKAFIFTSLWEGFPNVLIEALAVGKSIISTDCRTGPREILAPKTDFLLEAKEPQMEEFGILMPNFERKLLKANELLTKQEKIWMDFLSWVLENDKILKKYEELSFIRAYDFHINKIIDQWRESIKLLT